MTHPLVPTVRIRAVGALLAVTVLATACGGSSSHSTTSDNTPSSTAAASTTTVAAGPTAAQAALVAARPFEVHVPAAHAPSTAAPLLILLHGYGASGAIQETYLKLTPVTDAHGMLYVHLDGTINAQDRRFWNATDACCGYRSGVDDSAYIAAVIADVKAKYRVDPRRVFIVGHSNGGFMAYRMACDHADQIAAIVSIEGATWAKPSRCNPSQAVATLEVHGTADQTITYNGAAIAGAHYPGARKTVETWARYDGCDMKVDRPDPLPHAIVELLPPATVRSHSTHCDRNGHAELWTQPDGVHIPKFSSTFADQIVAFLLAHPKR